MLKCRWKARGVAHSWAKWLPVPTHRPGLLGCTQICTSANFKLLYVTDHWIPPGKENSQLLEPPVPYIVGLSHIHVPKRCVPLFPSPSWHLLLFISKRHYFYKWTEKKVSVAQLGSRLTLGKNWLSIHISRLLVLSWHMSMNAFVYQNVQGIIHKTIFSNFFYHDL